MEGFVLKDTVELIVTWLANILELLTAVIIAYAALNAIFQYFADAIAKSSALKPKRDIRLALGRSLAVALEILLAADILKTAVAPTWNEIGQLAAIAAIRTALNYFLERELRESNRPEAK